MGEKKKVDNPTLNEIDELPKEYWEAIVASDLTDLNSFKKLAAIWAKDYYTELEASWKDKKYGR